MNGSEPTDPGKPPPDTLTIHLAGESLEIELSPEELDADSSDIVLLLQEVKPQPPIYTRIAQGYLRAALHPKRAAQRKELEHGAERVLRIGVGSTDPDDSSFSSSLEDTAPSLADVRMTLIRVEPESPAHAALWVLLASLYSRRMRLAPKMLFAEAEQDVLGPDTPTKDAYRDLITVCMNKAAACQGTRSEEERKEGEGGESVVMLGLARGIHQLATLQLGEAMRSFEEVLKVKETNLVALHGKARILFIRKQFVPALKLFQKILELNPKSSPDPRIGIGLCLYSLNHTQKAHAAFSRAVELDPGNAAARTLLALCSLNMSRLQGRWMGEKERRGYIISGTQHVQTAFQLSLQKSAAATNVLAEVLLKKGDWAKALKLSERTIQFADTLPLLSEGYVRAGRICFAWGTSISSTEPTKSKALVKKAGSLFALALDGQPRNVVAGVGVAGCAVLNDDTTSAINTLDTLIMRVDSASSSSSSGPGAAGGKSATAQAQAQEANPHPPTLFLASLRTADERERGKARVLYERVGRAGGLLPFVAMSSVGLVSSKGKLPESLARFVGKDDEMYVEIARLWWAESGSVAGERTRVALEEAVRIQSASSSKRKDPRLLNDIAVLRHLAGMDMDAPLRTAVVGGGVGVDSVGSGAGAKGSEREREEMFEDARKGYVEGLSIVAAGAGGDAAADETATTMLYNLGRVYEELGEEGDAREAYEKILGRHGEYLDAKIRLAAILSSTADHGAAHELLKQALASSPGNLNLRAYYVSFLLKTGLAKPARDFLLATLKDYDKHDIWSLVQLGGLYYSTARELRDSSTKGLEERRKNFVRSAELFEKALSFDNGCAYAAQGLGIVSAEDALGLNGTGLMLPVSGGGLSGEEQAKRVRNAAREALDVFVKVRECVSDGSVYCNMGHCYYAMDEFDRAIEAYETASSRFWNGQNVSGLMCLCRSWYAKAMKDQSYKAICEALKYAQKALIIQPGDKAVMYNIAMIQQKSAEMLFTVPPAKRTLKDLQRVIEQAHDAQKLFASLASDPSPMVPYNRDIADQRKKYGDNMLRRGEEHLSKQRAFEDEARAKLDTARLKRQEEKDRAEEAERQRLEQLKLEAARLAEERKIAREKAMEWTREVQMESDEEKERKATRAAGGRKRKGAITPGNVSGDEDVEDGVEQVKEKKKRGGRVRKGKDKDVPLPDGEEEEGVFTDEDAAVETKPVKRGGKKRVVRDDDEEEEKPSHPRKKQYKSKEFISDTDDEDEPMPPAPTEVEA